jgi:hypothetical protein
MFPINTHSLGDVAAISPSENDLLIFKSATNLWTSAPLLKIANKDVSNAKNFGSGDIILASDFANIVYLPIKTNGPSPVSLNATTPIANLTSSDYGRILWIHNVSTSNKVIRIPSGSNNVWLEGGAALDIPQYGMVKFMWLNVGSGGGSTGRWVQTDKVITATGT